MELIRELPADGCRHIDDGRWNLGPRRRFVAQFRRRCPQRQENSTDDKEARSPDESVFRWRLSPAVCRWRDGPGHWITPLSGGEPHHLAHSLAIAREKRGNINRSVGVCCPIIARPRMRPKTPRVSSAHSPQTRSSPSLVGSTFGSTNCPRSRLATAATSASSTRNSETSASGCATALDILPTTRIATSIAPRFFKAFLWAQASAERGSWFPSPRIGSLLDREVPKRRARRWSSHLAQRDLSSRAIC